MNGDPEMHKKKWSVPHRGGKRISVRPVAVAAFMMMFTILQGCMTAPRVEKPIVYPSPPEEPKIVFFRTYSGALDYRRASIFDAFLGTPSGSDFEKPYGVFA